VKDGQVKAIAKFEHMLLFGLDLEFQDLDLNIDCGCLDEQLD